MIPDDVMRGCVQLASIVTRADLLLVVSPSSQEAERDMLPNPCAVGVGRNPLPLLSHIGLHTYILYLYVCSDDLRYNICKRLSKVYTVSACIVPVAV